MADGLQAFAITGLRPGQPPRFRGVGVVAAIQAALDAAAAQMGAGRRVVIYFPPAVYVLDAPAAWEYVLTLEGGEAAALSDFDLVGGVDPRGRKAVLRMQDETAYADTRATLRLHRCRSFEVRDLVIDGNRSNRWLKEEEPRRGKRLLRRGAVRGERRSQQQLRDHRLLRLPAAPHGGA